MDIKNGIVHNILYVLNKIKCNILESNSIKTNILESNSIKTNKIESAFIETNGIRSTDVIQAYAYSKSYNMAAITIDKPGIASFGIGANGTSNEIKFSICNRETGSWNTSGTITLRFDLCNIVVPSITSNLTGNADTSTKLQTSRNINGVAFDGTKDILITTWVESTTAPSDTTKLWIDTSSGGNMLKFYSTVSNSWKTIHGAYLT